MYVLLISELPMKRDFKCAFRFVLLSGLLMKYWILLTGAVVTFLLLIDPVWHFGRPSLPKVLQTPRGLWCQRVPKWHRSRQSPNLTRARPVFTSDCCGCDGQVPARRVYLIIYTENAEQRALESVWLNCQIKKAMLLVVGDFRESTPMHLDRPLHYYLYIYIYIVQI